MYVLEAKMTSQGVLAVLSVFSATSGHICSALEDVDKAEGAFIQNHSH